MATASVRPAIDIVDAIYSLPVGDIEMGPRLRPVDQAWAQALALILDQEGQHDPITVVPYRGKGDWAYTLVAGAHRLTAHKIGGRAYIKAVVLNGVDAIERRTREISENLWRKGLDPVDRASFVAELVALHKERSGIDPAADGRAVSAQVRWQKALGTAADDATATIAVAYGWADEIGEKLGFSVRTIRNDLLLHRRLEPRVVARLRGYKAGDGHPALLNATQLRALAKLNDVQQREVVELLVTEQAKSVSGALGMLLQRPVLSAESKALSAFIGSFARMGLVEKKGALAQLGGMLPKGFALIEGEAPRRQSEPREVYREELLAQLDEALDLLDGLAEDEVLEEKRAERARKIGLGLRLSRMTVSAGAMPIGGAQ